MLNFFRKKSTSDQPESNDAQETPKAGIFSKIASSVAKTSRVLTTGIKSLFSGRRKIDQELLDELEILLLRADVGLDASEKLLTALNTSAPKQELDSNEVVELLKNVMTDALPTQASPELKPNHTILMIGINGAGKTTTIGKLANKFKSAGHKVMVAAADTFRAAAVEQLQVWGERNDVPVIAQHTGADSASVVFDAITAAKARQADLILCDTAGRLHTQSQLMDELIKVKRVAGKAKEGAPDDIWLVIDATCGQNGLKQAVAFNEALGLTGVIITKLDGSAKAGIIFAIYEALKLPIYYIGVGEGIDDLQQFNPKDFVQALFE